MIHRILTRCSIPILSILLLSQPLSAAPPVLPTFVITNAQARVDAGYTPGLVIGMVNADGRTTFSYGARSWEDPTPTDTSTIYEIGSVTKTFTAVLLAQMVETGDVAFTNRVAEFLPAQVSMPANGGDTITLEQLGAQRSGLPGGISNLAATVIDVANPFSNYTANDLYDFLAGFTLPRAPGSAFEYSNFGIGLLGHALALSQGMSYEALLKERVIDPLGMSDTTITLTPEQEARRAPGHGGFVQRPRFDMNDLAAAGGLFSTANDLMTYVEHNLGLSTNGPLNAAMTESHVYRGGSGMGLYDIGLTWWLWNLGDVHEQHGGDTLGSTAFVAFRKSTQTGVVVLSNARAHTYAAVLGMGFHCLNPGFPVNSVVPPATIPIDERRNYVGRYTTESLDFQIGLVNNELTLLSNGLESTAYAQGNRRFTLYDAVGNVELTFSVDGNNQTDGLTLMQAGQTVVFTRERARARLSIQRDGLDVLIGLNGEGDQDYQLQSRTGNGDWQNLGLRTTWDAPYRSATTQEMKIFRAAEAP